MHKEYCLLSWACEIRYYETLEYLSFNVEIYWDNNIIKIKQLSSKRINLFIEIKYQEFQYSSILYLKF